MDCVNGKVEDLKVRVFKRNQKLSDNKTNPLSESQGFFMLRVKNKIGGVSTGKDGSSSVTKSHTFTEQLETFVFDHEILKDRHSMAWWIHLKISGTQLFPLHITPKLAKNISNYLFSCFHFNNINHQTSSSRKPTIVIRVDVYMRRTREEEVADVNEKREEVQVADVNEKREEEVADVNGGGDDSMEEEEIVGSLRSLVVEETFVRQQQPRRLMNQVEAAMKVKRFNGDESKDDDMCSICLMRMRRGTVVAITPCSHMFHRDCVFRWLPKTGRCPMCRSPCVSAICLCCCLVQFIVS